MSRIYAVAIAALALGAPSLLQAATLEASSGVRVAPGETGTITVTLRAMGDGVVATQNDLGFGPNTPILALDDGTPDCLVNPSIDKEAAIFAYQPAGCGSGTACSAVRAVVVSLVNLTLIPDGAVVYSCRVGAPANAPLGTFPLSVDEVVLVDEDANELPNALGADGSVIVAPAPTATPTAPPTETPTATIEPSATISPTGTIPATATATATPLDTPVAGECGGDCNGDGMIAINELIIGVGIALGATPLDDCPSFANGDGEVGITDLIQAVNEALAGCS